MLKALSEARLQDEFEFVSISGTFGGVLCATLVWYALRKGERPIWRRLIEFWRDNTAQNEPERMINNAVIDWMRMVNRGMLPMFQISPASPLMQAMGELAMAGQRREFADFPALLRKHIDFDELAAWGPQPTAPVLIIGAASVPSGQLRKFNSSKEAIRMEHILASAAVPNLFPAVSTASTTAPTSLGKRNTQHGTLGSTSMARPSTACARISAATPTSLGCTSP